jgi:hypothetical protein
MLKFNRLKDCVVTNKNVVIRVDINVPLIDGKIEDDTRIKAVIPTLKYLAQNNAKVIVISHFGRPEGKIEPSMSISHLVARVQELLGSIKVSFVDDCMFDMTNFRGFSRYVSKKHTNEPPTENTMRGPKLRFNKTVKTKKRLTCTLELTDENARITFFEHEFEANEQLSIRKMVM